MIIEKGSEAFNLIREPFSTFVDSSKDKILIVDDDNSMTLLFSEVLESAGFQTLTAVDMEEALQIVSRFDIKGIILDQCLGDDLGTELLPKIVKISPYTKIVFMSSHGSVELATEAMSLGASGFLQKSDSVEKNIELFLDLIERPAHRPLKIDIKSTDVIGQSEKVRGLLEKISKINVSDTTILLTGESGVGKELFAKTIHKLSDRKVGPFIAVNCAAISENLLEAELFGWKKGAFTDAKSDRKGYFESCSGGTLLLDEIGETSPSLQTKLLRVLQEKEVTPVGSCDPIKIDTRVIAATNKNLREAVLQKKIREDLYYRLAVLGIEIPPLRERVEDIGPLVESFLKKFNKKFSKNVKLPNAEVYARLKSYPWPGNVRELYNAIERAVLLAETDTMEVEELLPNREIGSVFNNLDKFNNLLPLDYEEAKNFFEKTYINQLLKTTNYSITDAAKVSNQDRTNIYRILKKHNIKPPKS